MTERERTDLSLAGVARWLARGRALLAGGEREQGLRFAPLGAVASYARRESDAPIEVSLEERDPAFVAWITDGMRAVGEHYFRWQVRGIEHVPASGGALLVGNHNGGVVNTDSFLTVTAIADRFGLGRAVHPLVHDLVFHEPALATIARKGGALPAGHDGGRAALERGRLVLVYPGSDLDATRRFSDRHRIELGGRKGFLRLAARTGVPIVPVVSVGTHEQMVVLRSGRRLAKWLGLRRLRIDALPLTLSIPWGISLGALPYLPLPAQTTVAFGPPISLDGVRADDAEAIDRAYERVRAAMQAELDALARDRVPFLGASD
jgi:1-acyl-sn-glycerol-3-phosphate acyltransferase